MRLGALEAGGTKMVCSIGDETGRVFSRVSYPTLSPAETMPRLIEFFKSESIDALGVASFGPIDLHQDSPTYGYITSTPKKGWTNYPFLPELREAIGVPCGYDNDVNAAAIAEHRMGAAKGLSSCIYVTVGTGVGAGIAVIHKNVCMTPAQLRRQLPAERLLQKADVPGHTEGYIQKTMVHRFDFKGHFPTF